MRLSEKTFELNFCAQFSVKAPVRVLWFGLTQNQEAKLGFDACTKLGGKLLIFQFKASRELFGSARRFRAKHDQMVRLRTQVAAARGVFYVFPLVGTSAELIKDPDVLTQSRLLDIASLPHSPPPPTKKNGHLRKPEIHDVDVYKKHAVIHSEPFGVPLTTPLEILDQPAELPSVASWFNNNFTQFGALRRALGRYARGAVLLKD